jgi:hypothetical protein
MVERIARRRAWNLAVDQQPAAVAFPETAAGVTAVMRRELISQ